MRTRRGLWSLWFSSVFTDNVATKSDIADMATKNDLSNLHFQIKADMKDLENRVTMRFAWMALATSFSV